MIIEIARGRDKAKIAKLDRHIPLSRLGECIRNGQVYVLKDDCIKTDGPNRRLKDPVVGVLRYSLFWQTIPFLDHLYIEEGYRRRGYGTKMMCLWETDMEKSGYTSVLTSTQADEDAWRFYEKLGYRRIGGFFPAGQEAEEWIYEKQFCDKKKG
jgi:GNAT superfamily N-acetyltransferase